MFTFEKLGVFFFALFISGLIITLKTKSNARIILLAILVPWIFFTFFSILKDERFLVPIYPYIAIISAVTFQVMRPSYEKTLLIAATILMSLATFLGTVWGKGPLKEQFIAINIPIASNTRMPFYLTGISHPPDIYKKSGCEIIAYIIKDSKNSRIANPQVLSLFTNRILDEPMMTYNLYQTENPLVVNNYLGTIIQPTPSDTKLFINNVLNDNEYVLVKTGKIADSYFAKQNYIANIALNELFKNYFNKSKSYEKLTDIWIYQDSSIVTIYKRKRTINKEVRELLAQKYLTILKHM